MKITTTLKIPTGSEEALEDLDGWLREFDRIISHISGNRGLIPEDRITHLLAAWPFETDVGENMRLDQQSDAYLLAERSGRQEELGAEQAAIRGQVPAQSGASRRRRRTARG